MLYMKCCLFLRLMIVQIIIITCNLFNYASEFLKFQIFQICIKHLINIITVYFYLISFVLRIYWSKMDIFVSAFLYLSMPLFFFLLLLVLNDQADETHNSGNSGVPLFIVDFSRVTSTRPLLSSGRFIPAHQVLGRDRRKCC